VLGTKLHVPATRRPLVARPRLTELVRSGASELPSLVLVSAPAGFGKTTLLSQWLSPTRPGGQAPRVAWLSLDEGDNDLRRLLAHLVGALETSGLEVGAQTTARLESAHELSTETILTDLVNDVDLMAEETVVALDDYHVIDNVAVHEATSFLLEHLPRHVGEEWSRVVDRRSCVITRRPPERRQDARPSPPCRSGRRHAPAPPGAAR
jgi:LuxR family maltose regulon positive regulatory protein